MRKNKEEGITLIALIITIILLIILAAVSLKAVFSDRLLDVATSGVDNYVTAQEEEGEEFNNVDRYIKVATNKKPVFDYVDVKSMTSTSATIKIRATDGDGEDLTYILYMGTSEENLEEKSKKENIEQGTEIELTGEGINTTNIVYYRVDVLDQYATVQSQVSTIQNKRPEIGKAKIIDITRTTAKAVIIGTDEDIEDRLAYKIYIGTDKNALEESGRIVQKENVLSGTEEILTAEGLTPGIKYFYKIAITDGKQTVFTEGEFMTIENKAPTVPTVIQTNTQKNSFTITAQATDPEGDKLIYKVYTGKAKDNITTLFYTSKLIDSRCNGYNNTKYKCSR